MIWPTAKDGLERIDPIVSGEAGETGVIEPIEPVPTDEATGTAVSNPAFDTAAWRLMRNQAIEGWVGDPQAVRWLLDYFDVCELFDDMVDGDKPIESAAVERALWECLVDMPGNPFFLRYAPRLLPVVSAGINAWLDATAMEREKKDLHWSYVLRDVYMLVVPAVIEITRGRNYMRAVSADVTRFFGKETYDEYAAKLAGEAP